MTGYINHVPVIIDGSSSMVTHAADVIAIMDDQIVPSLAERSKIHDQETRVSIFGFSSSPFLSQDPPDIRCMTYDTDVLRTPRIAGLYKPGGRTPLCSAVISVIADMMLTPVKYGDHSFLVYLITDGEENSSSLSDKQKLPGVIRTLPDNWTLAAFAPSATAKHYLKQLGFPDGNVEIWDPSKKGAVLELGENITRTADTYMTGRASGLRSTSNLFAPSASAIKTALVPLTQGSYYFEQVSADDYPQGVRIDEFVTSRTGKPYTPGNAFYQMMKRERIQPYKKIAVQIGTDVFTGPAARQQLGLPEDHEVRVSPGNWKGYAVFVMSTSFNRKLLGGTRLLLIR